MKKDEAVRSSVQSADLMLYPEEWSYNWKCERENQNPELVKCQEIIRTWEWERKNWQMKLQSYILVIKKIMRIARRLERSKCCCIFRRLINLLSGKDKRGNLWLIHSKILEWTFKHNFWALNHEHQSQSKVTTDKSLYMAVDFLSRCVF